MRRLSIFLVVRNPQINLSKIVHIYVYILTLGCAIIAALSFFVSLIRASALMISSWFSTYLDHSVKSLSNTRFLHQRQQSRLLSKIQVVDYCLILFLLTGVSEKQQVFIKRLKISVNYRVTASPCGPTEASSIVILRWKSIISVIQNYEQLTFDGLPVFGSYYRVSQKTHQ